MKMIEGKEYRLVPELGIRYKTVGKIIMFAFDGSDEWAESLVSPKRMEALEFIEINDSPTYGVVGFTQGKPVKFTTGQTKHEATVELTKRMSEVGKTCTMVRIVRD